jgi:hypothetical protein
MGDKMSEKEIIQNATLHIIRPQKYQMAFWGLVILIGGIAIGAATTVMVLKPRLPFAPPGIEGSAQRMLDGMANELNLTAEQRRLIEPLIKQHMAKLDEIRSKAQPQITEQFRLMHDEIAKVLTPEQLSLWEERLRRIPENFRPPMLPRDRHMPGNGPDMGPGTPQGQVPGQQPGMPGGPGGQPQDSRPQQPGRPQQRPASPPSGAVNMDQPTQDDRLAAAIEERSAQGQTQDTAQPQTNDQQPQPAQQDDGTPPPPPDDGGGPGGAGGPPDGGPMGPPPDGGPGN